MVRKANAVWQGTGKEGKGVLSTQSGVLQNTSYSFNTRFEDGIGTNPEELIGAAHAGCFAMKLSFNLTAAGFIPTKLDVQAEVKFQDGSIVESKLILHADVPGIDRTIFEAQVKDAELNFPISKLLKTSIVVEHHLA